MDGSSADDIAKRSELAGTAAGRASPATSERLAATNEQVPAGV